MSPNVCAGCFRPQDPNQQGWVFWEMSGSPVGKASAGAWLCPGCKEDQEKRRKSARGKSRAG